MEDIYWREPLWLLLTLQPFVLLLMRKLSSRKKLSKYADTELQAWVYQHSKVHHSSGMFSRNTLYVASWLLLAIAMAGPRLLLEQPASSDKPKLNIMVVVDVSRSMRTRDIQPDRLRRAKIEISELLQSANNSRISIILYTARAHLLLPFTRDMGAVNYYLKFIDTIPLPVSGSIPTQALKLAAQEIKAAAFKTKSTVLWLTDGDFSTADKDLDQIRAAVNSLKTASVPLYILGLGSAEGDAIPDGKGSWVQHQNRPVISRMNESLLSDLAKQGQGRFILAQDDDSDWQYLYRHGMAADITTTGSKINNDEAIWQELYPWFLLPAILLLFICLIPFRLPSVKHVKILSSVCLLIVSSFFQTDEAAAAEHSTEFDHRAYQSYLDEKFEQSADFYRLIPGFRGRFGEGNSYFRLEKYSQAITQFNQAIMLADNDQHRGKSIYNLANAHFMMGDYSSATVLYQDALLYLPAFKPALINISISRSLEQLVDEQLQKGLATRMGSGPRTARAQQGLDINSKGSMAFDNEEERKNAVIDLPLIPPQEIDRLLARGLEYIRLVQDEHSSSGLSAAGHRPEWNQDVAAARLRMRELEDLQVLLWKRLFEMEEGFAAPLEEAETIPGVKAW